MTILKLNGYIALFLMVLLGSCIKANYDDDFTPGDPLPPTGGYSSSDEVFKKFLVAYWNFDDNNNETISNTAPTQAANATTVDGGIKGKALSLSGGYVYFAKQFDAFKTSVFKSWSISVWVKVKNNGSKRTMILQLARKDVSVTGCINFLLNTNGYPATNDSVLRINPTFTTVTAGTQDNLNNVLDKTNLNNWNHIVLTYDGNTGVFDNWLNGVKVGNFPNRGTGNNLFNAFEPNEIIIGSNYNGIPGKVPGSDANVAPMTGMIDDLRVFSKPLSAANIKALYYLGKDQK